VALEGYLAIAPDACPLSAGRRRSGRRTPLLQKLDRTANIKNFVAAVAYLKTHRSRPEKSAAWASAGRRCDQPGRGQLADLAAGVPFYGLQPAVEDVPRSRPHSSFITPVRTKRINAGIPAYEEASKKRDRIQTLYVRGAGHAFFNDSNAARYNKEAAILAWQRTLAFFKDKLRTSQGFLFLRPESGANRTSRLPGPQTSLPRPARSDSDASTPRPRLDEWPAMAEEVLVAAHR